jgi:exopolysaccharide biosynthesis polyprenyl glycosylphosphotransferase
MAQAVSVGAARLKFRDKALPDRLVITSLVCDAVVILYALVFSFWSRFLTPISEFGIPKQMTLHDYAGYIGIGAVTLIFTLTTYGIYERQALLRFRFVSMQIVKACSIWAIGFLGLALIFKFQPQISRFYVLISAVLVPATLLLWRLIFHKFLARSMVAVDLRQRILFIGWNEESERLTREFLDDAGSAYEVVGCVSAKRAPFHRKPLVRVLGGYDQLVEAVRQQSVDMVILTDVNFVKGDIVGIANTCEREMVQFKVIPSYFQILVSGLHLETVSGIPVLGVSRLPLDRFVNLLLKRVVDVIGAIVGLVLSAPLLVIFGILIYRESPGPVIFAQDRMGRRGMPFRMYKLRSMTLGADKQDHLNQSTLREDARVLKIGAFMRRWNIDEVPQFWNVLIGDMSLVGPRPERLFHSEKLSTKIPHYNARYNATPGITGWAQVKGLRGDTDLTERINSDLYYLENWSLFLDFQIMFMTFFHRENAY